MTLHKSFYKACSIHGLDPREVLHYLVDVFIFGEELSMPDIDKAFIMFTKDGVMLPKIAFFEEVSRKKTTVNVAKKDDEFMSFIQEYRSIFKGIRHRSEGVKSVVIDKMLVFTRESDYTREDILNAARYHVFQAGGYAMNADNFIYHAQKGSTLLEILESGEYEHSNNDGRELL